MSEIQTQQSYESYIRTIEDFPKEGIRFYDINPLIGDQTAFARLIKEMAEPLRDKVNKLVGFDARGFLFIGAMATELGVGCVLLRKAGKLPGEVHQVSYGLEYGADQLEIQTDALESGEKVALIDDVIATGGTALAGIELARMCGAEVVEFCSVIDLPALEGSRRIADTGVAVRSLVTLGGEN